MITKNPIVGGLYVEWAIERSGEQLQMVRTDALTGFEAIVLVAGLRRTGVQSQIVTADRQTARLPVSKHWKSLANVLAVHNAEPVVSALLPCRQ